MSGTPFDLQRAQQAVCAAFTRDELRVAVAVHLQEDFDAIVAPVGFAVQVFDLLQWAQRRNRLAELLSGLAAERPDNAELQELAAAAPAGSQPSGPIPLQKPPRAQHFTGRAADLEKLLADLQPGAVVTLCGPGGVGKSSLAVEVIWALAPGDESPNDFPDGIIFHAFYHQPQADQALEAIARAYNRDPRPNARAAAAQALKGRHCLLVLDGAEAADDLEGLLAVLGAAGSGCGVLITTRRHADALGDFQDVEPLPHAEGLQLLRAWAGPYAANEGDAKNLVRLLGGLPLALFLAGRYLRQRGQWAGEYASWLQETGLAALHFGERQGKSVPLLLQRSLQQVSAAARAAFGVTGVLALAPFDAEAVAAALQLTPAAARHTLGELVDYGLLLRPNDRYAITHALAHTYAREQAAPPAEVINRLAWHYAALAERESQRGPVGFAILDRHRAHLAAVQAAALAAGQWDAVRQVTWEVRDYLNLKGYWSERVSVLQAGLDAARAAADRYDEGAFLNDLGLAYAALGETRRAVELYEQALVIDREIGDRRGEGAALGNLGVAYKNLGETRRAIELYEQYLVIAREIGDRRGEGNALGSLGNAYADLGETRRAVEYHEQYLVIAREIGDRRGEGNALGNLGNAYKNLGETRRAIGLYEQRLVIAREIGDRRGEGAALGNLGVAYKNLGETRSAVELCEQRLVIAREIGDRRGEGIALGNLGRALADVGNAAAIRHCRQSLAIKQEIGDRIGEGEALNYLGYAYCAAGRHMEAVELHSQAVAVLDAVGALAPMVLALVDLAETHLAAGDPAAAVAPAERAAGLAAEHGYRLREAAALWALAQARRGGGEHALAHASARQAHALYAALDHPKAAVVAAGLAEWGMDEGAGG